MSDDDASLEERVCFLVPLNKLPAERRKRLLEQSEVLTLKRKQTLFEQGQRDEFTFYVLEGEIEMYADDSLIKRVAGGDGASFQPLAQLQPRQMTAIAKTRVEVLRVRRALLDQLLSMDEEPASEEAGTGVEVEEMEADQSGDWLMTLLQSELFSALPPANIQGLLDTLETVEFAAGDEVVRQGEPGDYYYAIQSGAAEVVRAGANRRAIKLADLTAGSTFGEEALVSGARRNATVRMTESGELARLTKEDFTRLIRAPLLTALSRERAEERVAAGARWLDVRFEDEAAHNGIEGALNLPLGTLRTRVDELDRDTAYVCYCDTGGRSSAAAFLLAEKGFDVAYVEGGAVAEPIPEKPAATAAPTAEPVARAAEPPAVEAAQADAVLEAEARNASLEAQLEQARLTMEKAERMMREAAKMRENAEHIVAEKLAAERAEIGAASEKLAVERAEVDAESEKLAARLAEAQKLRDTLAAEKAAAEAAAREQQAEVEARVKALEEQTREHLAAEEQRLESLFKRQAEQIESARADREAELREQLEAELASERAHFEQEFLRANTELERAQEERRRALAAQQAASEEAKSAIASFKAEQQRLLDEQQERFEAERRRLADEAARIEKLRLEAVRAREAAELAKAGVERELAEARSRQDAGTADVSLVDAIAERASAADRELQAAIENESAVGEAARENEDELERTYDTANEINMLLQKELDEWVGEQREVQESTLQQEILSRQKEMVARIKARAESAQREAASRNQSLLDEIAAQLDGS